MIQSLRKTVFGAAALSGAIALSGCNISLNGNGDGVPLAELDMSGDVPTAIALVGPDTVVISEGTKLDIQVDGEDAAVTGLRFKIDGDTLTILREADWKGSGGATIRVTMPAPAELTMAGSGTIQAENMAKKAEITNAGSGSISIASITATQLDISMMGAGDITASGTAESMDLSIAGSGTAALDGLKADKAEISIAGSGDVRFASDGTVDVSIAGSGDVTVTGNAKCTKSAMGSGTVTCKPADAATKADPAAE